MSTTRLSSSLRVLRSGSTGLLNRRDRQVRVISFGRGNDRGAGRPTGRGRAVPAGRIRSRHRHFDITEPAARLSGLRLRPLAEGLAASAGRHEGRGPWLRSICWRDIRAPSAISPRASWDRRRSAIARRQFGREYFDGTREQGYGGYRYDGRWLPIARDIAAHFALKPGDRVLDVGCAKGFLMRDLMQVVPGLEAWGLEISQYAIDECHPDVRGRI